MTNERLKVVGLIAAILAFSASQVGLFPAEITPWIAYASGVAGVILAYFKNPLSMNPPVK